MAEKEVRRRKSIEGGLYRFEKTKSYTPESLLWAVESVTIEKQPISHSARLYNVPEGTLRRKVREFQEPKYRNTGAETHRMASTNKMTLKAKSSSRISSKVKLKPGLSKSSRSTSKLKAGNRKVISSKSKNTQRKSKIMVVGLKQASVPNTKIGTTTETNPRRLKGTADGKSLPEKNKEKEKISTKKQQKEKGVRVAKRKRATAGVLTVPEEKRLISCLSYILGMKIQLTEDMIKELSGNVVAKRKKGKKVKTKTRSTSYEYPTNNWVKGFLARHPEFERRAQNSQQNNLNSCAEACEEFYRGLTAVLKESNLIDCPSQIFTLGEVGKKCSSEVDVALTPRQIQAREDHVSIQMCICADGKVLPSAVVYQGKFPQGPHKHGCPDDWLFRRSPTGCMDAKIFKQWLDEIFIRCASRKRPSILLMNVTEDHLRLDVVERLIENEVIVYPFPPATTHAFQPLHVAVFPELKNEFYARASDTLGISYGGSINKGDIAKLWADSVDRICSPYFVKSAFQQCRIMPIHLEQPAKSVENVPETKPRETVEPKQLRSRGVSSIIRGGVVEDSASESEVDSMVLPFLGQINRGHVISDADDTPSLHLEMDSCTDDEIPEKEVIPKESVLEKSQCIKERPRGNAISDNSGKTGRNSPEAASKKGESHSVQSNNSTVSHDTSCPVAYGSPEPGVCEVNEPTSKDKGEDATIIMVYSRGMRVKQLQFYDPNYRLKLHPQGAETGGVAADAMCTDDAHINSDASPLGIGNCQRKNDDVIVTLFTSETQEHDSLGDTSSQNDERDISFELTRYVTNLPGTKAFESDFERSDMEADNADLSRDVSNVERILDESINLDNAGVSIADGKHSEILEDVTTKTNEKEESERARFDKLKKSPISQIAQDRLEDSDVERDITDALLEHRDENHSPEIENTAKKTFTGGERMNEGYFEVPPTERSAKRKGVIRDYKVLSGKNGRKERQKNAGNSKDGKQMKAKETEGMNKVINTAEKEVCKRRTERKHAKGKKTSVEKCDINASKEQVESEQRWQENETGEKYTFKERKIEKLHRNMARQDRQAGIGKGEQCENQKRENAGEESICGFRKKAEENENITPKSRKNAERGQNIGRKVRSEEKAQSSLQNASEKGENVTGKETSEKSFLCPACGACYKSESGFVTHLRNYHNTNTQPFLYTCPFTDCTKKRSEYSSLRAIRYHVLNVHQLEEKNYHPENIQFRPNPMFNITPHRSQSKNQGSEPELGYKISATHENTQTMTRGRTNKQKQRKLDNMNLECPVCFVRFKSNNCMTYHFRKIHETLSPPYLYSCPVGKCPSTRKYYGSVKGLTGHLSAVHNISGTRLTAIKFRTRLNPDVNYTQMRRMHKAGVSQLLGSPLKSQEEDAPSARCLRTKRQTCRNPTDFKHRMDGISKRDGNRKSGDMVESKTVGALRSNALKSEQDFDAVDTSDANTPVRSLRETIKPTMRSSLLPSRHLKVRSSEGKSQPDTGRWEQSAAAESTRNRTKSLPCYAQPCQRNLRLKNRTKSDTLNLKLRRRELRDTIKPTFRGSMSVHRHLNIQESKHNAGTDREITKSRSKSDSPDQEHNVKSSSKSEVINQKKKMLPKTSKTSLRRKNVSKTGLKLRIRKGLICSIASKTSGRMHSKAPKKQPRKNLDTLSVRASLRLAKGQASSVIGRKEVSRENDGKDECIEIKKEHEDTEHLATDNTENKHSSSEEKQLVHKHGKGDVCQICRRGGVSDVTSQLKKTPVLCRARNDKRLTSKRSLRQEPIGVVGKKRDVLSTNIRIGGKFGGLRRRKASVLVEKSACSEGERNVKDLESKPEKGSAAVLKRQSLHNILEKIKSKHSQTEQDKSSETLTRSQEQDVMATRTASKNRHIVMKFQGVMSRMVPTVPGKESRVTKPKAKRTKLQRSKSLSPTLRDVHQGFATWKELKSSSKCAIRRKATGLPPSKKSESYSRSNVDIFSAQCSNLDGLDGASGRIIGTVRQKVHPAEGSVSQTDEVTVEHARENEMRDEGNEMQRERRNSVESAEGSTLESRRRRAPKPMDPDFVSDYRDYRALLVASARNQRESKQFQNNPSPKPKRSGCSRASRGRRHLERRRSFDGCMWQVYREFEFTPEPYDDYHSIDDPEGASDFLPSILSAYEDYEDKPFSAGDKDAVYVSFREPSLQGAAPMLADNIEPSCDAPLLPMGRIPPKLELIPLPDEVQMDGSFPPPLEPEVTSLMTCDRTQPVPDQAEPQCSTDGSLLSSVIEKRPLEMTSYWSTPLLSNEINTDSVDACDTIGCDDSFLGDSHESDQISSRSSEKNKKVLEKKSRKIHGKDKVDCKKCSACGRRFPNVSTLRVHIQMRHENADLPRPTASKDKIKRCKRLAASDEIFQCNKCSRTFSSRKLLVSHKVKHLKEGTFRCFECSKGFDKHFQLKRHMRMHRKQNQTPPRRRVKAGVCGGDSPSSEERSASALDKPCATQDAEATSHTSRNVLVVEKSAAGPVSASTIKQRPINEPDNSQQQTTHAVQQTENNEASTLSQQTAKQPVLASENEKHTPAVAEKESSTLTSQPKNDRSAVQGLEQSVVTSQQENEEPAVHTEEQSNVMSQCEKDQSALPVQEESNGEEIDESDVTFAADPDESTVDLVNDINQSNDESQDVDSKETTFKQPSRATRDESLVSGRDSCSLSQFQSEPDGQRSAPISENRHSVENHEGQCEENSETITPSQDILVASEVERNSEEILDSQTRNWVSAEELTEVQRLNVQRLSSAQSTCVKSGMEENMDSQEKGDEKGEISTEGVRKHDTTKESSGGVVSGIGSATRVQEPILDTGRSSEDRTGSVMDSSADREHNDKPLPIEESLGKIIWHCPGTEEKAEERENVLSEREDNRQPLSSSSDSTLSLSPLRHTCQNEDELSDGDNVSRSVDQDPNPEKLLSGKSLEAEGNEKECGEDPEHLVPMSAAILKSTTTLKDENPIESNDVSNVEMTCGKQIADTPDLPADSDKEAEELAYSERCLQGVENKSSNEMPTDTDGFVKLSSVSPENIAGVATKQGVLAKRKPTGKERCGVARKRGASTGRKEDNQNATEKNQIPPMRRPKRNAEKRLDPDFIPGHLYTFLWSSSKNKKIKEEDPKLSSETPETVKHDSVAIKSESPKKRTESPAKKTDSSTKMSTRLLKKRDSSMKATELTLSKTVSSAENGDSLAKGTESLSKKAESASASPEIPETRVQVSNQLEKSTESLPKTSLPHLSVKELKSSMKEARLVLKRISPSKIPGRKPKRPKFYRDLDENMEEKSRKSPKKRKAPLISRAVKAKSPRKDARRPRVVGKRVKCTHSSCMDGDKPSCCIRISQKCEGDASTKWLHISSHEHYCRVCWEYFERSHNIGATRYAAWAATWSNMAQCTEPSVRLHIIDQHLPFWVQCMKCDKWRSLPRQFRLTPSQTVKFECHAELEGYADPCEVPEEKEVAVAKRPDFLASTFLPPLLKYHPAAPFLLNYYPDSVGMSITDNPAFAARVSSSHTKDTAEPENKNDVSFDSDSETKDQAESKRGRKPKGAQNVQKIVTPQVAGCEDFLQPFIQPEHPLQAQALHPCSMDEQERQHFPTYIKMPKLYLTMRNLVLAMWCLNPKEVLTARRCSLNLICRGLMRIRCAEEVENIVTFLTLRGLINIGVLTGMPSAGLLPPHYNKMSVLVVGGGIAGVAAARQLRNFGTQVTLLEASSELGGRLRDVQQGSVCVGEGAQTLYGSVNNPILVVCHQCQIARKQLNSNCRLFSLTGSEVDDNMDAKVEFHFNAMLDNVAQWRENKTLDQDTCLLEKIQELHKQFQEDSQMFFSQDEEALLQFHISNMEYACGCSLDKASAFSWDQNENYPQFLGEHLLLQDGLTSVIKKMAQGLDVRLQTEVNEIIYTEDGVKVRTKSKASNKIETFAADKVIVALPVSIIKENKVTFTPPLPEAKLKAIHQIGMGVMEKVIMEFENDFWHEKSDGADFFGYIPESNEDRGLFNIFNVLSPKVLVTYIYGTGLDRIQDMNDVEISSLCCEKLAKMFTLKVKPEPVNCFVTKWRSRAYSGMAYSYLPVGSTGKIYDDIAQPVLEKLYFAGEATNRHHPQSVTGAFMSGLREAYNIARSSQQSATGRNKTNTDQD